MIEVKLPKSSVEKLYLYERAFAIECWEAVHKGDYDPEKNASITMGYNPNTQIVSFPDLDIDEETIRAVYKRFKKTRIKELPKWQRRFIELDAKDESAEGLTEAEERELRKLVRRLARKELKVDDG